RLSDVVSQFPRVRNVHEIRDEPVEGVVDCMQGEAILDGGQTWWGRLVNPGRWRGWKMWAFQRSRLLIVFTLLHADERDQELESMTRMVLRCLELPDAPADPPEVFARRALQLARQKFPLLSVELV